MVDSISSPIGTSSWDILQSYTIAWDALYFSEGALVRLELWSNANTVKVLDIANNVSANQESYLWTVPYYIPTGSNYSILIGEGTGVLDDGWGDDAFAHVYSDLFQINGCKYNRY